MKITENITLYQCDFCKKKLFLKHAMVKHEDLCLSNPKNFKDCMECTHLEKTQTEVHWIDGNPDYAGNTKQVDVFRCNKLDKLMFPFSIERRKLHEKYETYSEQEPMPSKCEDKEKRTDIW